MKKLIVLLLIFGLSISLLACNKDKETEKDLASKGETKNEEVKKAETTDLSSNIEDISKEVDKKVFVFEVINNSDSNIEVPFKKGGGFAYVVRNDKGEEVDEVRHGEDIGTNQVMLPGDFLETKMTFFGLPIGKYELEVWLESELDETYSQKIEFEMKRK